MVVVLPASTWAMIPMLRTLSSMGSRATSLSSRPVSFKGNNEPDAPMNHSPAPCGPPSSVGRHDCHETAPTRLARGEAPKTDLGMPSLHAVAPSRCRPRTERSSTIILRNPWAGAHQVGEDTVNPKRLQSWALYRDLRLAIGRIDDSSASGALRDEDWARQTTSGVPTNMRCRSRHFGSVRNRSSTATPSGQNGSVFVRASTSAGGTNSPRTISSTCN